jgi:transposase
MAWRRGKALSQDLRDRVLAAPGTAREVAARFGVSVSYVVKARARLRDAGTAAAGPQRNRVPPRLSGHEDALRAEVARRPSATCDELRLWAAGRGVALGRTAVWKALARLGLTLKKSRSGPRSRTAPT